MNCVGLDKATLFYHDALALHIANRGKKYIVGSESRETLKWFRLPGVGVSVALCGLGGWRYTGILFV